MNLDFIHSVTKLFQYYKSLGEKTFQQLPDKQLFELPGENSNSIAVMVNHLHGNMLSRWTDFLQSDGEKEWRNRDGEFENSITDRSKLIEKWEEGWHCLFTALQQLNEENMNDTVYIRSQAHSIPDAINRQLGHYAYHVGQIVFLGRQMVGNSWKSLSIPKGQSSEFNAQKLQKGNHSGHFTDDLK